MRRGCRTAWCCCFGSHMNRPGPGSEISRSRALVRAGAGSVAPAGGKGRWDISSTCPRSAARLVARRCGGHRAPARLRASPADVMIGKALHPGVGAELVSALRGFGGGHPKRRDAGADELPPYPDTTGAAWLRATKVEGQGWAVLFVGAPVRLDWRGVSPWRHPEQRRASGATRDPEHPGSARARARPDPTSMEALPEAERCFWGRPAGEDREGCGGRAGQRSVAALGHT